MDLERIIAQINQADAYEIVEKAMDRYRAVYPEREIIYLSLPKYDLPARKRILEHTINLLIEQEKL